MDKDTKQSDTMSVSTISNGGYNYETPPPAYQSKKSTAVALAKIAATTILAAAFILGAFIVAASYVSSLTKCSCPETQPDPHHHVTSHKLPEAASFVGLQQAESQNGLSKLQEKPKPKEEEKEISIPIAVTTSTTEAPPAPEEEVPEENSLFGDEEATENEVPVEEEGNEEEAVRERIMDLLKKMVQIDPSMKGNMKCRVSKQKILPFESRGILPNKPVLQVHCTKAVIRPIPGPFTPFGSGPNVIRIPSPLTSSGIIRMQRPPILPFNNLAGPDIPQPPGLFDKPQRPDLKIPMMLKLLANMPLLPGLTGPQRNPIRRLDDMPFTPLDEQEQEEEEPPFPFFPQRKIIPLDTQQRAPNARFIVPFRRNEPINPQRDFLSRDNFQEEPQHQSEPRIFKLPLPFVHPPKPDQGFSSRILPFIRPFSNDVPPLPNQNLVPPRPEQEQPDEEVEQFPVEPSFQNQEEESERFPFLGRPQEPQDDSNIRPIPIFQGPPPEYKDQPQPIRFVQVPEHREEQEPQPLNFLKAPEPQELNQNLPIPFFRIPENQEEVNRPPVPFFQGPPETSQENEQQLHPVPFFRPQEHQQQQESEQPVPVPVQVPFFQPANEQQNQAPFSEFPNEQPQQQQPPQHFHAPEPSTEEQAPPAPQGPIVIPLRRDEPHPPPNFPIPDPLSIIDRIRNLQNIPPPQPVSPRTYHLNKHTIPETDKRGGQPPVEISSPQQQQ